jgi:hypothetical protein
MKRDLVPVSNTGAVTIRRPLTPAQFGDLAELPPELEWLAILSCATTCAGRRWKRSVSRHGFLLRLHRRQRTRVYRLAAANLRCLGGAASRADRRRRDRPPGAKLRTPLQIEQHLALAFE